MAFMNMSAFWQLISFPSEKGDHVVLAEWTTRPQDHRTTGPQDHRTTGPQDHRTTGPLHWTRAELDLILLQQRVILFKSQAKENNPSHLSWMRARKTR